MREDVVFNLESGSDSIAQTTSGPGTGMSSSLQEHVEPSEFEYGPDSHAAPSTRPILTATLLLLLLLTGAILLALWSGAEPIDLARALRGEGADAVILRSRLTRVALAAFVGAALGVSGAALQSLVENPLADPFILGLSGGAAIGATAAIALGLGAFGLFGGSLVGLVAFAGAALAALLVFSLGRVSGRLVPERLVLVGVVFNAFASAVILALQSLASPDLLQSMMAWLLGSLGYPPTTTLVLGAVVVTLGVVTLLVRAPALNLLSLGELDAHGLGLDVRRTRAFVFAVCAVLVAAAVSLSGVIGFVGLIVPHLARLAFGADNRVVVLGSALGGAAFLVTADLGTRLLFRVAQTEPPVGVLTALLGAPLFLWLLSRRTRRSES